MLANSMLLGFRNGGQSLFYLLSSCFCVFVFCGVRWWVGRGKSRSETLNEQVEGMKNKNKTRVERTRVTGGGTKDSINDGHNHKQTAVIRRRPPWELSPVWGSGFRPAGQYDLKLNG